MDEATASTDAATDAKIQATIRDLPRGTTVLTIAHRLDTIAECGRVIVLERGGVVAFGEPARALAGRDGVEGKMKGKMKGEGEEGGEARSLL